MKEPSLCKWFLFYYIDPFLWKYCRNMWWRKNLGYRRRWWWVPRRIYWWFIHWKYHVFGNLQWKYLKVGWKETLWDYTAIVYIGCYIWLIAYVVIELHWWFQNGVTITIHTTGG
ncbi:MAG: hypothetical protein ACXABY_10795 [Candidatus Thorarchaeota archaeon]|jgi:hypothetical protein